MAADFVGRQPSLFPRITHMAVYYTSKAPSNGGGPTIGVGWSRNIITLEAQVAMTTAMIDNANDDVGLFYAPTGFVVMGGSISATDMDTGGPALLIDVGIAGTEELFFADSAVGGNATYSSALAPAGHFYKFTARTEVRAFISTAATTPAAGTLKVALWGFVDPDYNTTALTAST